MGFIDVQNRRITIEDDRLSNYLNIFAIALERNLANPDLPYFSKEDLVKDEIVTRVVRRSQTERNYDIYCGNMAINTDVQSFSVKVGSVDWTRYHDTGKIVALYHASTDVAEKNRRIEKATNNCNTCLDAFEADFRKFQSLLNLQSRCIALTDENYWIDNFFVSWLPDKYGKVLYPKEEISFYVYKGPNKQYGYKCVLLDKTFEEIQDLLKMSIADFQQFLNHQRWH